MPQTYEEKNWSTWIIQRKCKDKPIKFLTGDYGWTKYWEKAHQYGVFHGANTHICELQKNKYNREKKHFLHIMMEIHFLFVNCNISRRILR